MSKVNGSTRPSKLLRATGYVLSALPVLLMVFSSSMKLLQPPMVVEGFTKNGISSATIMAIGIVELLCAVLYVVPRTAVLGAVLMTGYLGGAVYVHVQAGELALLVPVLLGICAWGGLFLRDERIRALLPFRRSTT
jgi:hypothetical protein